MRTWALAAASVLALTSAARADAPPAASGAGLNVTIYNDNLALVDDRRMLDIAKGRQRLEFKDVSAAIKPETVSLSASGVDIVEQNFDYDLLTPTKMMEKAVGHQVQIIRTNPGTGQEVTETATVLAANQGVVLKIGDHVEVLRDDGVPTRVIFDRVPENLRAIPTLSVTVDADAAGQRLARLSYLTNGLAWRADYVATFDEKAGKLDLIGWVTLTNQSGTSFEAARTQLVAGNVSQGDDGDEMRGEPIAGVVQAGSDADTGGSQAVGDVHLYTLPERTTIAQNETKQVSFLDAAGWRRRRSISSTSAALPAPTTRRAPRVVVDFASATARRWVFRQLFGGEHPGLRSATTWAIRKFVGENQIGHTLQGLGASAEDRRRALTHRGKPTLTGTTAMSRTRTRYAMSYLIHNARPEAVTVELRQGGIWGRGAKVASQSLPSRARSTPSASAGRWRCSPTARRRSRRRSTRAGSAMRFRVGLALAALVAVPLIAGSAMAGDVVSAGPQALSVTVYRDDAIADPAAPNWNGLGLWSDHRDAGGDAEGGREARLVS